MIVSREKTIKGTFLPDKHEYRVLPKDVDTIDWNELFKWASDGEKVVVYIHNTDKNSSKFTILQAYCGCKNIKCELVFVDWIDYFSVERKLEEIT